MLQRFLKALQQEGSWDFSMSLRVLHVSVWVLSMNPSLLPQAKDMHLRIGGKGKIDTTAATTGSSNNDDNNNGGRESNYGNVWTYILK